MANLGGAGVSLKRTANQKFWVSIPKGNLPTSQLLAKDQWVQLWKGEKLLWSGQIKAVNINKTKALARVAWKFGGDDYNNQDTVDVDVTVNPTELTSPGGALHNVKEIRVVNDGPG